MPSAKVVTTIVAKPGFFRNTRTPYRMSCHSVSRIGRLARSRNRSFVWVTPPKSRRARFAPHPATDLVGHTRRSTQPSGSQSRCPSRGRTPLNGRALLRATTGRADVSRKILRHLQKAADDARGALPIGFFGLELPRSCARQRVGLDSSACFRLAPTGHDPTCLFELQQRRVERPLIRES